MKFLNFNTKQVLNMRHITTWRWVKYHAQITVTNCAKGSQYCKLSDSSSSSSSSSSHHHHHIIIIIIFATWIRHSPVQPWCLVTWPYLSRSSYFSSFNCIAFQSLFEQSFVSHSTYVLFSLLPMIFHLSLMSYVFSSLRTSWFLILRLSDILLHLSPTSPRKTVLYF